MKIAILSDFHFGFGYSPELENDSFENVEEAMERALNSDLVLIGGDIFDSPLPKTQTWAKAIKILARPLLKPNPGINLAECSKELKEISKRTLAHLPVIALHGNHERRARGELNAVQALENAGLLIHLHGNTIIFEKDGVKVAIHGMSAVPERFAKNFLYQWNPKPINGCVNILFLHQNVDPYVYSPLEPPSLTLSNLPKGFDLIINGHIHMHGTERIDNTLFLIPGSLVITQFEKGEAEIDKGFLEVEVGEEIKVNFISLKTSRKFFYEEIKLEEEKPIREQLEKKLNEIIYTREFLKPPLIRLRIFGKEVEAIEQELRAVERKYSDKAVIKFVKELESPEITRKIELLQSLREQRLSVEEIGLTILKKNLDELSFKAVFDHESIFKLLSEGDVDKALAILLGEQKTLAQLLKKSVEK
ncbi:MAG: DNA repair exonuclease [Candidatus Aenigmarchaeota archaeon]|nr:DNA repair exonuclease [Candidatus Aenigmarchaeota archaeon]